jgi:site-specific DNA recombinase
MIPFSCVVRALTRGDASKADPMIRAASYARYSSDLQNGRSIDGQHALNRETAARHGFTVVASFEDRELSAATVVGRDGYQAMMR